MTCGFVMAQVYAQMLRLTDQPTEPETAERAAQCYKKALGWYRACIDTARDLESTIIQGRSFLELGDLYLITDKPETARDAYQKSVALFEQSDAEIYLQRAREKLEKLNKNHF